MKYQIVDNVSHYIIMDNTYCVFHLTITSRSMHVIIIINTLFFVQYCFI